MGPRGAGRDPGAGLSPMPPTPRLGTIEQALRARGVPRHYRRALLEELQSHAQERVAALEGEGLSPDEAWHVAIADLGPADDVAELAATTARSRVHRAPVTTMILGPVLAYTVIAVAIVPLMTIALLGEATLVRHLGGIAAPMYGSAVFGSVLLVATLARMASAHPGLDRHAVVGSVVIALLCGLLHPTGSAERKTLQIVFEPTVRAVLLMLPALAVTLATRLRWHSVGWR